MIIIRENIHVDLYNVSKLLNFIKIESLNIFSISINESEEVKFTKVNEPVPINYVEMSMIKFIEGLNNSNDKFNEYNKNSIYILRDGDYENIKNMLTNIENHEVNIVRGGSQKSHVLSPLEVRLSSYLLVFTNFNFKLLNYLNHFNDLDKYRYLPCFKKYYKNNNHK